MTATVLTFAASLALSIVSGAVLGKRLEQLGARAGFTEAFLGIVTALGADAPEIASAVTALHRGHQDLGLGIVFGSSIFNLAAVLGLSALIAGRVGVGRRALAFNGGVAAALSVVVCAQLVGWLSPVVAAVLIGGIFLPYVTLSAMTPRRVTALGLPFAMSEAVAEADRDAKRGDKLRHAGMIDVLTLAPSAVAIVVSSIWMVDAAAILSANWHLSQAIVGTVVMATLTSIPNVVAGVRLSLRGRGSAVVSEAFTSNSLNLLVGVSLPALAISVVATSRTLLVAGWLFVMSLVAMGLMWRRGGLTRMGGSILIAIYLAFLVTVLSMSGR